MNPSYDFTSQVALVTGGSSGMGRATAQAFAETGAAVILADVNEAALSAAAEALTTAGHDALGVVCDVSQEDQVEAMVNQAVATFGRLDMAFNNAGIQAPPTDAADEPAETFDRVNAINLRGVWACMKHELGRCALVRPGDWQARAVEANSPQRGRRTTVDRADAADRSNGCRHRPDVG